MRFQQNIYIQNGSNCSRNSGLLTTAMSSDICTFSEPKYYINGANKLLDDTFICDIGGIDYEDMVLSAVTECFSGITDCFNSLSWDLEVIVDSEIAFSGHITTAYSTANTITQNVVNNSFISALMTLGYQFTYDGNIFTIPKPYGVENFSVNLCLDIDLNLPCNVLICPSGYTQNEDATMCYKIDTTPVIINSGTSTPILVGDKNSAYSSIGARFYEDISNKQFPITADTSSWGVLRDNNGNEVLYSGTVTSDYWGNGANIPYIGQPYDSTIFTLDGGGRNLIDGRLNITGVKGQPLDEWHGFSKCYNVISGRTYYIGLGSDNFCKFLINGTEIVELGGDSFTTSNFGLWHVFPFYLNAGTNIIEMLGKNDNGGSGHNFGFEIYSADTLSQLSGATGITESGSIWNTSYKIGDYFDVGETVAYSCPTGYSLDLCSEMIPTCSKISYTGGTIGPPITGACNVMCGILCDNTYPVITTGDTGVYIIGSATTVDLGFVFTGNTESFIENDVTFRYDVYKFNNDTNAFSIYPTYSSDIFEYSSFSGTNIVNDSIPVSGLTIDGEYLIKGYFIYTYCTEFSNKLGIKDRTLSYNGDSYGLYQKAIDYYFSVSREADEPILNGTNKVNTTVGELFGYSIFPQYDNQSGFTINFGSTGSLIVSLNGLVLANNFDYLYDAANLYLTITGGTKTSDVITIVGVSNGFNYPGLTNDFLPIQNTITSGTTNNQGNNSIYFNIDTNKYELYTKLEPNKGDNIIITLNGVVLAPNIDYYVSTTNNKRIILNGVVVVGDIINIFYNSGILNINDVFTNSLTIPWVIKNKPDNNSGEFIIEVADINDINFTTILFSGVTEYIAGVTNYNGIVYLTGNAGTKYIYRIKNIKRYLTIRGDKLVTEKYSESYPIRIQTNAINSY